MKSLTLPTSTVGMVDYIFEILEKHPVLTNQERVWVVAGVHARLIASLSVHVLEDVVVEQLNKRLDTLLGNTK